MIAAVDATQPEPDAGVDALPLVGVDGSGSPPDSDAEDPAATGCMTD